MNPIALNLFSSRLEAICEQMGEVLRNTAFSPNIRDRLDFSCAIFDDKGELSAQAAHIPVHLGSMAFAMADVIGGIEWSVGDQVILNNPYLGGTHLPDVTLIAPIFIADQLIAFVVNRAHHANIGSEAPGSMPVSSSLDEEGLIISPQHLYRDGVANELVMKELLNYLGDSQTSGDFAAQISANQFGVSAVTKIIEAMTVVEYQQGLNALNSYAARLADSAIKIIPDGNYTFEDFMDDDGQGNQAIRIKLQLSINKGEVIADFDGTAHQVKGNINCPLSVAAAGVYYVFRCLMPSQTPSCAGVFRSIKILAPKGCLLNANYPAAVAAGNVETSTRVVDVTLGALAKAIPEQIPAASHGSMNNVAMGMAAGKMYDHEQWNYYETIGGGMGAGLSGGGQSAVQTHMTNTLNTPIEVLETKYPLRVLKYAIRPRTGGEGLNQGGDGLLRQYQFMQSAHVSVLTERRSFAPWGLAGGKDGQVGVNYLNGQLMPAKFELAVAAGDVLTIETPGGGGYGEQLKESI